MSLFPIKGFVPTTMVDWDGKIATTVFMGGYNFRCPYCQNPELVKMPQSIDKDMWPEIEAHLRSKEGWIDGVCISGGEPTLHSNLSNLLSNIKSLSLATKLDTNGSHPLRLSLLIGKSLLDAVAMDVKTSFTKYQFITRSKISEKTIKESINLIISSGVEHEFRTTVVPGYVEKEDVLAIAEYLAKKGAKKYVLQQFNPQRVLDEEAAKIVPYPSQFLKELAEGCNEFLPTFVRGTN